MAETTQAAQVSETQDSKETQSDPAWFIDEKTPGTGERPEWLPANFKSASDVAKSYKELEKRFGAFTGAPESYDLAGIDVDDSQHLVKEITSVAKELNMSQDGLNKFLGRIASATEVESKIHLEEQVQKLGAEGEAELKQFKNLTKNYFKPEEVEVITTWIKGADDLKTFNKIMAHSTMSSVPTAQSLSMLNPHESEAQIRQEMTKNIDRYRNDKAYAQNISLRLKQVLDRQRG